jgi:predicted enzyme related to lactoylglutathione lyase
VSVALGKVTIDCVDAERNAQFWGSLLGLRTRRHHRDWFDTEPTTSGGPSLNFQPVASRASAKTPVHLDIWVDDIEATKAKAEELGATVVGYDPTSEYTILVMTDSEGIEFCIIGPRTDLTT